MQFPARWVGQVDQNAGSNCRIRGAGTSFRRDEQDFDNCCRKQANVSPFRHRSRRLVYNASLLQLTAMPGGADLILSTALMSM